MTTERRLSKLEVEQRKQLEAVWIPLYNRAFEQMTEEEKDGLEWSGLSADETQAKREADTFRQWATANGYPYGDDLAFDAQADWLWSMGSVVKPAPAPEGTAAYCERMMTVCREMAARPDCPNVPLVRYVLAHYLIGGVLVQEIR